jgi:hypothetical protein
MQILREWDEHLSTPGTVYKDCLIYDGGFGAVLNEMNLHESTDASGKKVVKFRGKFQEANVVNKNKRMYTKDILESNASRLQEVIKAGGLLGECDHPTDSIIHFANSCHKVLKLWWEGDALMGEGQILHTPMGMLLMSLINDGVRIGMSSRGVGSGKVNEEGVLVIGESYKLITFDAVADPSTHSAFQERVVSNTRETIVMPQTENVVPNKFNSKNETVSIDKISNPKLVLACLGGIFRTQTSKVKERIN